MDGGRDVERYVTNPRDTESNRLRKQLDRERAARDRAAAALERQIFEATTRDLHINDEGAK